MQNVTSKKLLLDWFTNALMDFDNETVLLISSSPEFNAESMRELLRKIGRRISCHINDLHKMKNYVDTFQQFRPNIFINESSTNEPAKNLILFLDRQSIEKIQFLIKICRKDNKKILFCGAHETSQVLNNISKIFKDNNLQSKPLPLQSNYYLDGYASDLIKLVTTDDLKQNLAEIIQHRIRFIQGLFLHDIYQNEQIQKKMIEDIILLQRTNLLSANLAMHLHHLTFFTSGINDIDAGRYIRENLGIKSKTFSKNSKKLKKINYKPLKSFKAYDLSINMEKQIRLDIASKIVRHIKSNADQGLDRHSIASITSLSIREVDEIFESYQRTKKSL